MRGKAHTDETKSAAIAALLTGQGVADVARQYKLPESTVRDLKKSLPADVINAVENKRFQTSAESIMQILKDAQNNALTRGRRSKIHRAQCNPKRQMYTWHSSPYVYVVHCSGTSSYKIGISKIKPEYRLSQLQTGNPYLLRFVERIETDDVVNIELRIHRRWQHRRGIGEWFELNSTELQNVLSDLRSMQLVREK